MATQAFSPIFLFYSVITGNIIGTSSKSHAVCRKVSLCNRACSCICSCVCCSVSACICSCIFSSRLEAMNASRCSSASRAISFTSSPVRSARACCICRICLRPSSCLAGSYFAYCARRLSCSSFT